MPLCLATRPLFSTFSRLDCSFNLEGTWNTGLLSIAGLAAPAFYHATAKPNPWCM